MSKVNLIGQRFGRLLVVEFGGKVNGKYSWLCVCDCGGHSKPLSASLLSGGTTSCGCLRRERSTTHGHTIGGHTREYQIWANIKDRCYNQYNEHYHQYGGRGITMYEDWVKSFDAFIKYIGHRPSNKHSVDRFPNNDGNYEPGNVRWATANQQMRNTRYTHNLTFDGKTLCIIDWAAETGISRGTINRRIKLGWDIGKILTTTVNQKYNRYKYEKG